MLFNQLLLSIDNLIEEFKLLLLKIHRILSQANNWEDNLKACKELCHDLIGSDSANCSKEKHKEIDNSKNFKQLFVNVSHYLSWDEYSVLSQIIDKCDSSKAELEFDNYKNTMALLKINKITSSAKPPPGLKIFHVIIDID